jgi:hypothetical protein
LASKAHKYQHLIPTEKTHFSSVTAKFAVTVDLTPPFTGSNTNNIFLFQVPFLDFWLSGTSTLLFIFILASDD